jgi:predicted lipid-binding transport protein (Tim44 family)
MPLSEHEQRLLDEMERNLYGSGADVHPTKPQGRPTYRSIVVGIIVAVVGLGILIAGVTSQLILIGVVGFVVMFLGVLLAAKPGSVSDSPASGAKGKSKPRQRSSFMQRMEQRWDGNREDPR